jgi:hypothetical protein
MKISYQERLQSLKDTDKYIELYHIPTADACIDFINRFVMTYDPRKQEQNIPFELFPKQEDLIRWLWKLYIDKDKGAIDKARDVGATWCFLAFSVWMFLFQNRSINLYSYKADAVHIRGDMNSLFGKVNFILDYLPEKMKQGVISNYMLVRRGNSAISGLCGSEPRGGRASFLFKDEAAFYEQSEKIEAALSEFADCIVDVSTHAGTNTIFFNKVTSGAIPVFIFEWLDNPLHTKELYDKKKAIALAEGMLHVFSREIDRNPMASIENVVIPNEYVISVRKCEYIENGIRRAGLDIADQGVDTNALCVMDGNELIHLEEWANLDVVETAKKAFWKCVELGVKVLQYDCIGLGAGTKGIIRDLQEPFKIRKKEIITRLKELEKKEEAKEEIEKLNNELKRANIIINMKIKGYNAGCKPLNPDGVEYGDKTNRELFENVKSQVSFKLRTMFMNTHKYMIGEDHDKSKILSFKNFPDNTLFNKFSRELSQPQHKLSLTGKIIIDKKPSGSKSPNLNDCFQIALADVEEEWINWSII